MSQRLNIIGLLLVIVLVLLSIGLVLISIPASGESPGTVITLTSYQDDLIRFQMTQTREARILSARASEDAAVQGTPCATATQASPEQNTALIQHIETSLNANQIPYHTVDVLRYRSSSCVLVIPEREWSQELTIVLQSSDVAIDRLRVLATVLDSLVSGWDIEMTFLNVVSIEFEDVTWYTNNFPEVKQIYLESKNINIIFQEYLSG